MSFVRSVLFAALLTFSTSAALAETSTDPKAVPSGVYQLDVNHASITFKVLHLGFSNYTGRFNKMEGTLNYNSENPEKSELDITIYPNSVDTNNAKLEEELRGDKWFDVIKFPRATFHATKIERTGPNTGKITGDLTFKGETHPVVLDTTLVGAGEHSFFKKPTMGFAATGTLKRSEFKVLNGIPMVGDDVTFQIDVEFNKAE